MPSLDIMGNERRRETAIKRSLLKHHSCCKEFASIGNDGSFNSNSRVNTHSRKDKMKKAIYTLPFTDSNKTPKVTSTEIHVLHYYVQEC